MKKVFCDICDTKIAEENPHDLAETPNFIIKYDTEYLSFPYHLCSPCSKKVANALESVGLKVPYWSK